MKFVFDMIAETKESLENIRDCGKAKKNMPLFNFIYFFWCSYEPFTIISTILVFMVLLAVSFGIEFYIFSSVALSLLFIVFATWSHKGMEAKAKEQMKAFESVIESATKKNAVGDSKDFEMFIAYVDVDKCKAYPVFATEKTIIKSRKMDFLFMIDNKIKICTGATAFDLLNPIRKAEGCSEIKNGAKCAKDIAIKDIKSMAFADGGVQITKPDDTKEVIYKCNDKTAKNVMEAYNKIKKINEEKEKAKKKEEDAKKKAEQEANEQKDLVALIRVVKLFKSIGNDAPTDLPKN